MLGEKHAAIVGKGRRLGEKCFERVQWIRSARMRHEADQRFGHCTVVSIWYTEMSGVLRNTGTSPLNRLFQRVTLKVNPRYAQVIAMIERCGWQPAGEERFEESVVGEIAGRFHVHRHHVR
ncbi:hypothetical protein [Paraburkholderia sp. JHI869]|uniref:hypothetical protein n=1 Tax=Paraburkholderia sp. JHI869 TaxID=3112959 RepID=UPI0031801756